MKKILFSIALGIFMSAGAANAGGWYLMLPPHEAHFSYEDRETELEYYDTATWPRARLYRWNQAGAYSTPEDCMGVLRTWRAQMDDHQDPTTFGLTGHKLTLARQSRAENMGLIAALRFAVCVASDDPRLKP